MEKNLTRESALKALREAGCPPKVIKHSITVEREAMRLAKHVKANKHPVDLDLLSKGALLHDIGRAITHDVRHGVVGGELLKKMGLGKFAGFAEHHVGAGIPANEAVMLGLPEQDFMPQTVEEKIVTYADKLVVGGHVVSFENALKMFKSDLGPDHPAIERFMKLHEEIQKLINR